MSDIKLPDTFVSSIKIKGLHFLPPVITTKRQIELQRYKKQAIKLEKRLQTCRDLKKSLQELLILQPSSEHFQSSESESVVETDNFTTKSLKNNSLIRGKPILSFDIVDVSEYGKNGITIIDNIKNVEDPIQYSIASGTSRVTEDEHIDKNINTGIEAACSPICNCHEEIFELNEHIDKTINEKIEAECSPISNCYEDILELIESNLRKLPTITEPSSECSISVIDAGKCSPPPRLIRSNSYILDNPSPILLAHLDKISHSDKIEVDHMNGTRFNRELSNVCLSKGFLPSEINEFSNSACNDPINPNLNGEFSVNFQDKESEEILPKIEVIHTDISVQHITIDCDTNTCEETDMQKSSLELVDQNCQLIEVLKSIPEDYSKKILDLIENQQMEQSNGTNFENSCEPQNYSTPSYVEKGTNGSLNCGLLGNEDNTLYNTICSPICVSPSQSIYYTLSSTCTVLPPSSTHIIDVENEPKSELDQNMNIQHLLNAPQRGQNQSLANHRRKLSVRQEICKQLDYQITTIKQEWAASIIGAHVKGYLTRRLLKTEKVQSLINTIKDALICALQLHSADNIEESDVELHRRLINQVTAACYAFHDIFFSLSVTEQMSIIATDRRRKFERAKRPASAPSGKLSTTTIKPRTSVSQSLTKV